MLTVRPVSADDVGFLWEMLYRASWSHLDEGATVAGLVSRPDLAYYVEGWGRDGDDGVIASVGSERVGAAWLRLLVGPQREGVTFVADDVPELAIAVAEGREGSGVGSRMLAALLDRHPATAMVLTVRTTNPAVRLYERFGFETVEVVTNRIGTASVKMVRRP